MKAIVYITYGPPDVLHLKEIKKPALYEEQVLVKVHAASINAGDWHMLTAGLGSGSFAEYVSVPESALVLKPSNVSFVQAASVPVAALTALQGLRDQGHIQLGQKVLINGASGGVGTYAVQIARAFGAEVIAVCSRRNLEMARSIGADHVFDYNKEDFTQNGLQYDLTLR